MGPGNRSRWSFRSAISPRPMMGRRPTRRYSKRSSRSCSKNCNGAPRKPVRSSKVSPSSVRRLNYVELRHGRASFSLQDAVIMGALNACKFVRRKRGDIPIMKHRDMIVAAAKTAVPFAIAAMAAVAFSAQSLAQQIPAPKAQQPKPTPPKNQPSHPRAAPPAQPPQGEQPNLTFTAWTKVCPKGQEANAKRICLTGKDGSIESGLPVVAAVLIEPE